MALFNKAISLLTKTFIAGTGGVTEGAMVVGSTSTVILPAGANAANAVGVAQEAADAGAAVNVLVAGIAVCKAAAAITTVGTLLKIAGTTGKVTPVTTDKDHIVGKALSVAGADGDEVLVLLQFGNYAA